jgi:prepilin-type N-terminal cleavage/methylation domain-containing protein
MDIFSPVNPSFKNSDRPPVPSMNQRTTTPRAASGFTLVELLVVIAIIIAMMSLALPAFNAIKGGQDLDTTASEIKGLLDQARTYAMANNTYVYVGFQEVDSNVPVESGTQEDVSANNHGGRITVGIIASRDGSKGYTLTSATTWTGNYSSGKNLVALGKIRHFENYHIAVLGAPPASGPMARPAVQSNGSSSYNLGDSTCVAYTPFVWPLAQTLPASKPQTSSQYYFEKVIQFDPQGSARIIQNATDPDTIASYMEIGLQPTIRNVVPTAPTDQSKGKLAAIQVDCMTGRTRLYKP